MVILESVATFVTDPAKMLIVVVSFLFAISTLLAWKKYSKPALLYAHLIFVLSPIFYFALSINCSLSVIRGLLSWCTALFAKFIIYILPPLMAFVFVSGIFIIPKLYKRRGKQLHFGWFSELCSKAGVSARLYLLDKAKPEAFALGESIFVSVGMFEILSREELEAVLLHELHHVKSNSSWNKFSAVFVRLFSPIAWFSSDSVEEDELAADEFACRFQKSNIHLKSAKRKVELF